MEKHRITLQPNIVDDIIAYRLDDGSIELHNDLCVLGSEAKLREMYGDSAQSILDSYRKSYSDSLGLSDDDLFGIIKSRNIQSSAELTDWVSSHLDSLKSSSSVSDSSETSHSD